MWLLPHEPDGTCANGRRHGSVPELRANSHFTHGCTCRGSRASLDSRTCGGAAPCPRPLLASSTAIFHDGRDARDWRASFQSSVGAESQHGTASEACSGTAAPQHYTECSCRTDTLVFASGITSSHAEFNFARCACRALGNWTAQSVTLHSWCASSAKHVTAGRRWRNAWNAQQPARLVTARQRCTSRTVNSTYPTAPSNRPPLTQSGQPPRT